MSGFYAQRRGDCKNYFALHKSFWRPWLGILA
jgi:hypothetical protein